MRDHSSNGTSVNGEHVHLAIREVSATARLEVGPYALLLRVSEARGHASSAVGRSSQTS